ncbi:MAG: transposase [Nevskiales bacterium]
MPRKPRLHVPGAVYHVILRGSGRQRIFCGDEDRHFFSDLVGAGIPRYGHRIHAYCWMSNHVHLAIQVAEAPLARIVQHLAARYARYHNARRRGAADICFRDVTGPYWSMERNICWNLSATST